MSREEAFPIGYRKLHRKKLFNFALNRWHSFGFLRLIDLREVGQRVKDFDDWKREMVATAEKAL